MQKFLFFTVLSLLTLMGLSSCSKDENSKDEKGLVGTTWKCIIDDKDWFSTISFVTETSFSVIVSKRGNERTYSGTYSYVAPKIVLQMPDGSLIGTITGKEMVLVEDDCDECIYTYVKQ